jgi:DNA-binding winged helix-turn-helix (wHTH) protein
VERAPEPVSKAQLLDLVWPGLVVEENNLQVQVSTLRKLLGPQTIVTIPGRGYSFTMPRVTGPRLSTLRRSQRRRRSVPAPWTALPSRCKR